LHRSRSHLHNSHHPTHMHMHSNMRHTTYLNISSSHRSSTNITSRTGCSSSSSRRRSKSTPLPSRCTSNHRFPRNTNVFTRCRPTRRESLCRFVGHPCRASKARARPSRPPLRAHRSPFLPIPLMAAPPARPPLPRRIAALSWPDTAALFQTRAALCHLTRAAPSRSIRAAPSRSIRAAPSLPMMGNRNSAVPSMAAGAVIRTRTT